MHKSSEKLKNHFKDFSLLMVVGLFFSLSQTQAEENAAQSSTVTTRTTTETTTTCSGAAAENCSSHTGGNGNNSQNQQGAASSSSGGPEKLDINVGINLPDGNLNRNAPPPDSSSTFKRCHSLIPEGSSWAEITTRQTSNTSGVWANSWKKFRRTQGRKLHNLQGKKLSHLETFYEEFNKDLIDHFLDIAECEAMRSITGYSKIDDKSSKSGKESVQKSVDGKVVCKSVGIETQDYQSCLTALNTYNAALVGTAVFTQVQTVKYQGDSMEAMSGLDPNDPTAGLKAQKRDIEGRAQITNQRAGLDVTKAVGLGALMSRMPTHADLGKHCRAESSRKIKYSEIYKEFDATKDLFYNVKINARNPQDIKVNLQENGVFEILLPTPAVASVDSFSDNFFNLMQKIGRAKEVPSTGSMQNFCNKAISASNKLILNGPAKEEIKNAMIAAGIDGVKHKLTADQLNKQANQVGKVIDEVNKFNPEELPQFQGQDFQGSECTLDPSAEGCDDFVQERSFGFQDRGPLQIHGMENASNFRRGEDPESGGSNDSAAGSSPNRSGAPKPIGIFDDKVAKKSGFDGRMPGAADVSRDGPAPASGGGGGGGAAGGGGSPPPSQVPQQKQGEDGPRMSDAGNSRAAYGGGGGSLSRSGGRGAMGRGTQEEEGGNPFAELFGDKDPTKNNTLNFRETASAENQINTPDTSIFEIISDRYVNVQKQDRLLEYKSQDPDELQ